MHSKAMVRGALLIALALVLQSIRIVLPMPQLLSTFVIGTLVHMMMILTLKVVGLPTAFLLGLLLPMSAYLQGQILLPFLIPVVWVGNLLFIFLIYWLGGGPQAGNCYAGRLQGCVNVCSGVVDCKLCADSKRICAAGSNFCYECTTIHHGCNWCYAFISHYAVHS